MFSGAPQPALSKAEGMNEITMEHRKIISLISPCISVYPLCNSV